MIRVLIQMCKWGDESNPQEIGRAYIANVGGDAERGDYEVGICRRGTTTVPRPVDPRGPSPTRAGSVKDYPRLAYNVWRLIARSVLASFPEEGPAKGGTPLISSSVMRGLRALKEHFVNDGHDWSADNTMTHVDAAISWLDGATDSAAQRRPGDTFDVPMTPEDAYLLRAIVEGRGDSRGVEVIDRIVAAAQDAIAAGSVKP